MKATIEFNGRSRIRMFNCDCMEFMAQAERYDLAIVDPPYGKRPTRGVNGFGSSNTINFQPIDDKWDKKPKKEYFNLLFNTTQNQIIWGGNYFIDNLRPTNCFIVWDKKTGNNPYADCELAWASFNSVVKKFSLMWLGSHCRDIGGLNHPTQKPVQLYKWLLTNYAKEGDTILDTHGGSMSIAIACWDLGFDLDICELDEDYFNDAVKRFEQHTAQFQLF